ncbi:hypothetical protein J8J40_26120, partial [Mycobacterium tuberculosis]|nr:hypothetical protein [Mycobacterium tuberculosis]
SALARSGTDSVVWLYDRLTGTVSARSVVLGAGAPDGVRVLSGLAPGDTVVVAGTQFMRDGMKVRPIDGQIASLSGDAPPP